MAIHFFSENTRFDLPQKIKRKNWLKDIIQSRNYKIGDLNYIFCDDEYLHQINIDYLNHNTYTDIITFDNSESEGVIAGDIFISVDRVRENAIKHKQPESKEFSRVLAHGVFHLMGYKDKTKEQALTMRAQEELAIELFEKT